MLLLTRLETKCEVQAQSFVTPEIPSFVSLKPLASK